MKYAILALVFLAFAVPALAADVTVSIPAGAVAVSDEICEQVRLRFRKPITTTKQQCLQLIVNEGLENYYRKSKKAEVDAAARTSLNTQVGTFEALLVDPIPSAFCGDGILDTAYGEQCDDGNTTPGDGCNEECQTE